MITFVFLTKHFFWIIIFEHLDRLTLRCALRHLTINMYHHRYSIPFKFYFKTLIKKKFSFRNFNEN